MDYTVWQESHMLIECLLNYFRSVHFCLHIALYLIIDVNWGLFPFEIQSALDFLICKLNTSWTIKMWHFVFINIFTDY